MHWSFCIEKNTEYTYINIITYRKASLHTLGIGNYVGGISSLNTIQILYPIRSDRPRGSIGALIKSTPIISSVDYACGLYEAHPDALSLKNALGNNKRYK